MLEFNVLETIKNNNLIENGDSIVVGVSGGPDSITLLDILIKLQKEINFKIVVAHINHMIRKDAIKDQEYVEEFCKKINVPCYVLKEKVKDIAKEQKIGTEEAGRNVRYQFFDEVLEKTKSNKIATAHTKNDNAETVLMNIIRGSGIAGLKGIDIKRENKYIRPLLDINREQIEEYCKENNLFPRIDTTNMENIYTRNKIRNLLIPYIKKEFNPNIIEAINRLSNTVKEENDYLENIIKEKYEQMLIEKTDTQIVLNLKQFNEQELVIKNRIVLYTINKLFKSSSGIEKKHIQDIIKLCKNNIGNKYLIPNKKVKILVKYKKIFFIQNQ